MKFKILLFGIVVPIILISLIFFIFFMNKFGIEISMLSCNSSDPIAEVQVLNNSNSIYYCVADSNSCGWLIDKNNSVYIECPAPFGELVTVNKLVVPNQVAINPKSTVKVLLNCIDKEFYNEMWQKEPSKMRLKILLLKAKISHDETGDNTDNFNNLLKKRGIWIETNIDLRDYWKNCKEKERISK